MSAKNPVGRPRLKTVRIGPSQQMVDMVEREAYDADMLDGEFMPRDSYSSVRNGIWKQAIQRVVMANKGKKLHRIANKLVNMAIAGDLGAIKEIGDRLDGKAIAQVQAQIESRLIISVQDERL